MGKKDRKQRKKKERQERLRKLKHLRHSGGEGAEEFFLAGPDDLDFELPSPTAEERMLRNRGPSLLGQLGGLLFGGRVRTPERDQAQELAYDALDEPDPKRSAELARRALALDPECADALYVLALDATSSRQEQIQLLERAVAAAERGLGGPRYFEENRGQFWGLLETRPYMRARAALADVLRDEGRLDEAIAHYAALLDLNPNDNQGLRDVLLGCYFVAGDLEGVRRLLGQYAEDDSAVFAYARVLERFLSGDREGAAQAREDARDDNPHVEAYLTGRRALPRHLPDFYSPGDKTEAVHCAASLADAWKRHPEAVSWLRGLPG
jgi:tetratricopeptide (TPR) repeat protein